VPCDPPIPVWPALSDEDACALQQLLTHARDLGFLGPGSVNDQITRSIAFASAADAPPTGPAMDLGSGGGLPALVLALVWPGTSWILIDSNQRRAGWLREAVTALGIGDRAEVVCERAEVVGRSPLRHQAQLVTARSFGPPGVTAECAAPLLSLGGCLLVADPPETSNRPDQRWPEQGLAKLGLELGPSLVVMTSAGPASFSRILAISECADLYPRRVGVPQKRPLF
jgi:16S rRNA (guanine527-N7)-methyltransferase